jgi:excinuclease ABC subunit A
VIKTADYLIDLGPEGGTRGGTIVATGAPEEVVKVPESYTGKYLKPILERDWERTKQQENDSEAKENAVV